MKLSKKQWIIAYVIGLLIISYVGFSIYKIITQNKEIQSINQYYAAVFQDLTDNLVISQTDLTLLHNEYVILENEKKELEAKYDQLSSDKEDLMSQYIALEDDFYCENRWEFEYQSNAFMLDALYNYLNKFDLFKNGDSTNPYKWWETLWINTQSSIHHINAGGFGYKFYVTYNEPEIGDKPSVFWINKRCYIDYHD